MFLKISQSSQEIACARVFFVIKLQAWGLQPYQQKKRYCGIGVFLWIYESTLFMQYLWTTASEMRSLGKIQWFCSLDDDTRRSWKYYVCLNWKNLTRWDTTENTFNVVTWWDRWFYNVIQKTLDFFGYLSMNVCKVYYASDLHNAFDIFRHANIEQIQIGRRFLYVVDFPWAWIDFVGSHS